jgi:hypothetical protein
MESANIKYRQKSISTHKVNYVRVKLDGYTDFCLF